MKTKKINFSLWDYQLPPREKLLKYGVEALSDIELLAIFLRTGYRKMPVILLAKKLLTEFGSLYALMNASHKEFCQKQGLGTVTYTQLKAVIELSRRYFSTPLHNENALTNPYITYNYLMHQLALRERETFIVLFLSNKHQTILSKEMFTGTYNSVEVHPREIVKEALKCNAAAIILAHNHPSGNPEPSHADRQITELIKQACGLIEVRVLDHIVIGNNQYVSFAEKGWI